MYSALAERRPRCARHEPDAWRATAQELRKGGFTSAGRPTKLPAAPEEAEAFSLKRAREPSLKTGPSPPARANANPDATWEVQPWLTSNRLFPGGTRKCRLPARARISSIPS